MTLLKARELMCVQKYDEAKVILLECIKENPKDPDYHDRIAELYSYEDNYELSHKHYTKNQSK